MNPYQSIYFTKKTENIMLKEQNESTHDTSPHPPLRPLAAAVPKIEAASPVARGEFSPSASPTKPTPSNSRKEIIVLKH